MHVHQVGGEINAKFDLVTLELTDGTLPADLKKEVLAWLERHKIELIKEWKSWQK